MTALSGIELVGLFSILFVAHLPAILTWLVLDGRVDERRVPDTVLAVGVLFLVGAGVPFPRSDES